MATKARDNEFLAYVQGQLNGLDSFAARPMFGGFGLYSSDRFFGIIHKAQLFLKVDDMSRLQYQARGSTAFRPTRSQTLKNYYAVPAEILEDPHQLRSWAQRAVQASHPA